MRHASLLLVMAALIAPVLAGESPAISPDTDLFSDPEFQREFLGSYGVRAEVEPEITEIEREKAQEILPLLSGDLDAAARALEEFVTPETSAFFDFTLGNIRFQQNRVDDAAAAYEAALEKFPSFLRAHKNLGLIRVRQNRFEEAVEHLSRVIELGGADGTTYGLLGFSLSALERWAEAESAFRNALLLDPGKLDWKMGLTQAVLKQEKYGEALRLCDELIRHDPERAQFRLLQANAYLGLNRTLDAAFSFEMVSRMGRADVATLRTLGSIYVNEELYDLAARAFERALERDPGQPAAQPLQWVQILARRGAFDEADRLARRVAEVYQGRLAPDQESSLLKVRARIAMARGQDADSAGVLERIVELDPLDGEALLLLGRWWREHGDSQKALFYFERAAAIDRWEREGKLRQAELLVQLGRYSDAVPLLKRVLELRPREDLQRYLEQVERAARARG